MKRKLILFIQSDNPILYVNIITHCVEKENVSDIYFAVNAGEVGRRSEAIDKILKIKNKFQDLCLKHPEIYDRANEIMPCSSNQIENKIIRVLFTNPESSIKELRKMFNNLDQIIVDISGCKKKVSSDIISSYILHGINHICCFELDEIVYSQDWKNQKLTKEYHNICCGNNYYEYIDFYKEGTTINSFNSMRLQGKIIQLLLAISIFLCVMVAILIQQEQNALAQYAAIILALATGLGLVNDIFGVAERFK